MASERQNESHEITIFNGLDESKYTTRTVITGSPASEAGFRIGLSITRRSGGEKQAAGSRRTLEKLTNYCFEVISRSRRKCVGRGINLSLPESTPAQKQHKQLL